MPYGIKCRFQWSGYERSRRSFAASSIDLEVLVLPSLVVSTNYTQSW